MKLKLCFLLCFCTVVLQAQTIDYRGKKVELGPHAFLVDGNPEHPAVNSPYVFKSFNEAVEHLTDGTPEDPMRVYIEPWVYWVNDPYEPAVLQPDGFRAPIGLEVRCEHLHLFGLSEDARDVVLASARGQSQGSNGNFTMLDFYGDGLEVRDMTFGNYCNIDLVYPRNPSLNKSKRFNAITQAQVSFAHGDRVYAENVRFMARLNLCNLSGARRAVFVNCHTESTDDSLNGSAVYINCTCDFYGQLPFGGTHRYGTVFLGSDFTVCHSYNGQNISKGVGRVSLIDTRYHASKLISLGWTERPEEWLRCYQYNVTLNGHPAIVGAVQPYNTISLDQKSLLGAYRVVDEDGTVVYNTYNLLRGEDDWDPLGVKDKILELSKRDGVDYANIATCLDIDVHQASLQTGGQPLKLTAGVYRNLGYLLNNQKVYWKVQPGFERFVSLSAKEGNECIVTSTNHEDKTRVFDVIAYTEEGLECAVKLTVAPDLVVAPAFVRKPSVKVVGKEAVVDYELDLQGRKDESLVTWYRDGIPVAVSRNNKPMLVYPLTKEDVGHVISVGVAPKHLRCEAGNEEKVSLKSKIKASQTVSGNVLETDFVNFPAMNQLEIKPGYWTVDAYKPSDTSDYNWQVSLDRECWFYGYGINGAVGQGMLESQQGARLRYSPLPGRYGDMEVTWQVDPAKLGGQGFASARGQYLDLFIKFDTKTLTGYALRAIRTTKFSNAVDIVVMKYTNGETEEISEHVSTDCFLTGCVMSIRTEGDKLIAHVEGNTPPEKRVNDPQIHNVVDIVAPYTPNDFGGIGVQHTSTVAGESKIMLHSVKAVWK